MENILFCYSSYRLCPVLLITVTSYAFVLFILTLKDLLSSLNISRHLNGTACKATWPEPFRLWVRVPCGPCPTVWTMSKRLHSLYAVFALTTLQFFLLLYQTTSKLYLNLFSIIQQRHTSCGEVQQFLDLIWIQCLAKQL